MDSGNSGSMQSSSGGDEEYDSQAESISPFFNPSAQRQQPPPPPPPLIHHQRHPPTLFDPPSHTLDSAFSQSSANPKSNPPYSPASVWSGGLRSDPNYPDFGRLSGLSSSSGQGPFPGSQSMPLRSNDANSMQASSSSGQPGPDQTDLVKNPKKRTRASRRAPTTVLTTDTTNFRQMVQEFTGIPAAPFSVSPYSRRLDLLGDGSSMIRSATHLDALGPFYPSRPSSQKVHQFNPCTSSSASSSSLFINSSTIDAIPSSTTNIASSTTNKAIIASIAGTCNNDNNNNSNNFSTGLNNYPLPSNLRLPLKQSQNLLNIQNPIPAYQSFLQSSLPPPPKNPTPNVPLHMGMKTQGSSTVRCLDGQLGSSHERVNANLGDFSNSDRNNNLARWRSDGGGSFDANTVNPPDVSGYMLSCSASMPPDHFHPEKGLENVSSRGEGTVDSWICPSD